jgi:hypothetical protein
VPTDIGNLLGDDRVAHSHDLVDQLPMQTLAVGVLDRVRQAVFDHRIGFHAAKAALPRGEHGVVELPSGFNDISNLWPELASPTPGFHEKDSVENYLHSQVCSGAIALIDAQVDIATNWLAVYNQMPH